MPLRCGRSRVTGWIVPISFWAWMRVTSAVWSSIAAAIRSAETMPLLSAGTRRTAWPVRSQQVAAGLRRGMLDVGRDDGAAPAVQRRRRRGWPMLLASVAPPVKTNLLRLPRRSAGRPRPARARPHRVPAARGRRPRTGCRTRRAGTAASLRAPAGRPVWSRCSRDRSEPRHHRPEIVRAPIKSSARADCQPIRDQAVSSFDVIVYVKVSGSRQSRRPAAVSACGYIRNSSLGPLAPGRATSCATL